ncbi:hydrogenase maturation nickel metallochaperone HypA [Candidatus Woesearchaeota archaeon]|nr:hydrogenase maturation nickel metallochaperone HypA [Candidatus Woesearchaeota archaeon]
MHETVIANSIIEEAKKQGNVKSITVEVGDLGNLPAEEIEQTLKQMVDWEIKLIKKKATVKCKCGYQGEPKILEKGHDLNVFVCPECGTVPEVIDGKDIILKEVEVE